MKPGDSAEVSRLAGADRGVRATRRHRGLTWSGAVAWWRRPVVRWGVASLVIVLVIARVGFGPVLTGLAAIDPRVATLAVLLGAVGVGAQAVRWRTVAAAVGLELPLPAALAGVYRAQFLNTVLPGGVVGDVHRGLRHGGDVGRTGPALRAVAWERSIGQLVQVVVTLAVAAAVGGRTAVVAATTGGVVLGALLLIVVAGVWLAVRGGPHSRPARVARAAGADLRRTLGEPRALLGSVSTSIVIVGCCLGTFLLAARSTGVTASTAALLVPCLVALLAMAVPLAVAGWGPREGAAAWAFGAAGLGAGAGVAASVCFGILVFLAALPGAAVMLGERLRRPTMEGAGG